MGRNKDKHSHNNNNNYQKCFLLKEIFGKNILQCCGCVCVCARTCARCTGLTCETREGYPKQCLTQR